MVIFSSRGPERINREGARFYGHLAERHGRRNETKATARPASALPLAWAFLSRNTVPMPLLYGLSQIRETAENQS